MRPALHCIAWAFDEFNHVYKNTKAVLLLHREKERPEYNMLRGSLIVIHIQDTKLRGK